MSTSTYYKEGAVHILFETESWIGLGGMTLLGLVINFVAVRTMAVGAPDVEGCPRWSWYLGCFVQVFIYPTLVFLAWQEKGFETHAWLQSKWTDFNGSFFYEKLWFYVFFGYLMKDMGIITDFLYALHHVACMVGILMTFALPCGFVPLLLGMCSLEIGSATMSAAKILPEIPHTSPALDRVYWIGMTISNLVCLGCCYYNAVIQDFHMNEPYQFYMKAVFITITLVLCYMRQDACNLNWSESSQRDQNAKTKKM